MGDRIERAWADAKSHPYSVAGAVLGPVTDAADAATEFALYGDVFNPLYIDKGLHAGFSAGLTHYSLKGLDVAAEGAERALRAGAERSDGAVGRYLAQAADHAGTVSFRQQLLFSAAVVAGFSYVKEGEIDAAVDYYDVLFNYVGWGTYHAANRD